MQEFKNAAISEEELDVINGGVQKKREELPLDLRSQRIAEPTVNGQSEKCPNCGKMTYILYPTIGWECLSCGHRQPF